MRDRYLDNDDTEWFLWEPIPLEPKQLYHSIMYECKKKGIPIRIMRIRKEDGKEVLMVQKRAEGLQK